MVLLLLVLLQQKCNSMGIAGAARGWNNNSCRIIPIKVSEGLNADGEDIIKLSDICKGINHAIKSGAEIINVSLSDSSLKSCEVEAIERAEVAGVVVVASAGNYGNSTKRYPAAMDYVIMFVFRQKVIHHIVMKKKVHLWQPH